MRRILLVLSVATITVVMVAMTTGPGLAANDSKKGVPKGGQGTESFSENYGESVNNRKGDRKNNVAFPQCNPFDHNQANNPHGEGCGNN